MLGQRFVQRGAAFDVRLDRQDQLLHRGLSWPLPTISNALHQRNARREHRRELAAEHRDVSGRDLACRLEELVLCLRTLSGTTPCRRRSARNGLLVAARLLALELACPSCPCLPR